MEVTLVIFELVERAMLNKEGHRGSLRQEECFDEEMEFGSGTRARLGEEQSTESNRYR